MIAKQNKEGSLPKWILVEAYRSGLARKKGQGRADGAGPEGFGFYRLNRHDVYRRFFKLPDDPFRSEAGITNEKAINGYRKLRLRSAVLLCESVRTLLKNGLIHFPQSGVSRECPGDHPKGDASLIFLTGAGVRSAPSGIRIMATAT